MSSRFEDAVHFAGAVTFGTGNLTLPNSSVTDAKVAAGAAIDQSKLQHQHRADFRQPNTTATDETKVVATIYGATGTLLSFKAGSIAKAVGDSTVTVDLKKNGTTVLTGVITLDNANSNRVAEAGTLSVTSLVAGDVLEVVADATVGTGTLPTGLFAEVRWKEDAA